MEEKREAIRQRNEANDRAESFRLAAQILAANLRDSIRICDGLTTKLAAHDRKGVVETIINVEAEDADDEIKPGPWS